jgi:pilus assembly protein CpaB
VSSRVLVTIAVLLLFAAGLVGYWGLQQGSVQANRAQSATQIEQASADGEQAATQVQQARQRVEDELLVPVVLLARAVSPHVPLSESDFLIERLHLAPPGSYSDSATLVGKTLWRELPAGTVLNESSFEVGGPLARMIHPDERALAIAIDEVVGDGGHLRPDDYVDVLLFLNQSEANADQTAQVVVPALRVLSVGDDLGLTLAGEPAAPPPVTEDEVRARAQQRAQSSAARTAVLAVPEPLLTRFALAAQVGRLGLAVRSAEEKRLESYYAGTQEEIATLNQQLFQFQKLALGQAQHPQPGLVPPPPRGIEVRRGSAVSHELP